MTNFGFLLIGLAAVLGARLDAPENRESNVVQHGTPFATPESIRIEHEELHGELAAATKMPGKTGSAAGHVAELLHPHFVAEEEFALPPLALLRPLADGAVTPEMRDAVRLADRLKVELPRMLAEHKAIVVALEELGRAASTEGHAEVVRFVEKLTVHAQHEEQVLYPAAVLVGEYLKLKLPR
jgi:hypothetical protein